jgi:hypothetical protein
VQGTSLAPRTRHCIRPYPPHLKVPPEGGRLGLSPAGDAKGLTEGSVALWWRQRAAGETAQHVSGAMEYARWYLRSNTQWVGGKQGCGFCHTCIRIRVRDASAARGAEPRLQLVLHTAFGEALTAALSDFKARSHKCFAQLRDRRD